MEPAARMTRFGVTLIRKMMADAPSDAISLGLGQTNEPVPTVLRDALRAAPAVADAGYVPNAGIPALRQAVARRYGVDAGRVVITSGVQEAVALATFGLVNPGDEVLVPDPGFPVYATLTELAGGVAVPYTLRPEAGFRPRLRDIEPLLTARTRMVVVCSPGNPTGAVAEPEAFAAIGRMLAERGIVCFSDEIYLAFQPGQHAHPTMLKHNAEAVVSSGLSKSHSVAGWRLGWMVVPASVAPALVALHQHWVTSVSSPVQQAALAAFTPAGAAAERALGARLATRQARAAHMLRDAGWDVASADGAFYVFARVPGIADDLAFATYAMHNHGVIVIPGCAFGAAGHGFVRISVSVPDAQLDLALQRLIDAALAFPEAAATEPL